MTQKHHQKINKFYVIYKSPGAMLVTSENNRNDVARNLNRAPQAPFRVLETLFELNEPQVLNSRHLTVLPFVGVLFNFLATLQYLMTLSKI